MTQAPPRFFVTGTDTDVGKTRVVAAFALTLRRVLPPAMPLTVVKAVQTGLGSTEDGDAVVAVAAARRHLPDALNACLFERELHRYRKPADAYSAALAQGLSPVDCADLARELASIVGAVIVEGLGGAAAPLNATQTIAHLAAFARLRTIVAVGLRLGCISHAMLTEHYLRTLGCGVAGYILIERWCDTGQEYRDDVVRCLSEKLPVLAILNYDPSDHAVEQAAARLRESFASWCPLSSPI